MLTMTETAAVAVKRIVARDPQAIEGGVRIHDAGPESGFELSLASAPQPDDTVVLTDGARVFLDASAAEALDDRVLDVELEPNGAVRVALTGPA